MQENSQLSSIKNGESANNRDAVNNSKALNEDANSLTEKRRKWESKEEENASGLKRFYLKYIAPLISLGWIIEFVCFTVISIACLAYAVDVLLGGYDNLPEFASSITFLFWWTIAISLAWLLTRLIREYYGEKAILALFFLIIMEVGIVIYKVCCKLFSGWGTNACNIIMIAMAAIYEAVIYTKIYKSMKRKTDKTYIRIISGEMIWCFGLGILFSVLSMIMERI